MDPASPIESQSCPLHFYDFRPLDPQKNCMVYCSLIDKEVSVSLSELEQLHAELVLMRDDVEKRIGLIESETTVLSDWQVKRDYKKRRHSDASDPLPTGPGRPRKTHEAPHSKRHKGVPATDVDRSSRKSKAPRSTTVAAASSEDLIDEDRMDRATVSSSSSSLRSKGEISDRFWSTVEPYCANITDEDLQNLHHDEVLDPSFFHIPPLGTHYSLRWSAEDMAEEKKDGGKLKGLHQSSVNRDTDAILEEGAVLAKPDHSSYGPLTLRLMASFLEEPGGSHKYQQQQQSSSPSALSSAQLEARIKDELTSLGLLDPVEKDSKAEEDEILAELKKVQSELRTVSEYNQQQSHRLLSLARAEMQRQVVREQLEEVDSQVMDWLARFTSYRQRKRREPISRKERDSALHALEERVALLDQL